MDDPQAKAAPLKLEAFRKKFPEYDDMSDTELADRLYQRHYSDMDRADFDAKIGIERPGVVEDVARSAASGVRRGIESTVGMFGDAADLQGTIAAWAAEQLGASPETVETIRGAARKLTVPGLGGLNTETVRAGTDAVLGEGYEPQTTAGEYAQTAGEFLPAAAGGKVSILKRAANVAVPAAVSETAGQLTEGTALEPYARAAGAVAAGVPVAMAGRGRGAQAAVAKATEGATPQQMAQAEALFQQAAKQGTPITRFEALQKITTGGTKAGDMQRVVEGAGGLRPFMAQRAAGNEAAVRKTVDTISPVTKDPSLVGPQISDAAGETITKVRKGINDATEPYYTAASTQRVDAATFARIQAAPGWKEAVTAIKSDPQLKRYVEGLPEDSVGFLNEVKKYLGQQSENAAGPMNAARNQQRAAGYSADADTVRTAAENASPEYAKALQSQTALRTEYLDPLLKGQLGKLAKDDLTTQDAINALFPRNPLPNSADEISRTVGALVKRNKIAASQLVRAHIESTFNQAAREVQSGANQFGGAGFAAALRGNPQQAKNLEAAVRALPGGDDTWKGLNVLLKVLEAQGQRQRIGSNTSFNNEVLKDLQSGSAMGTTATLAAGAGINWPRKVTEIVDRWRLGRNVDEIARLITDPEGARIFSKLASQKGVSVGEQVQRLVFLSRQGAASTAEKPVRTSDKRPGNAVTRHERPD